SPASGSGASLTRSRPFLGGRAWGVEFLGPGGDKVLGCAVHDLYDGQQMRLEKLEAWRALRERYGNRDESRVDRGTLLAPTASPIATTGPQERASSGTSMSPRKDTAQERNVRRGETLQWL